MAPGDARSTDGVEPAEGTEEGLPLDSASVGGSRRPLWLAALAALVVLVAVYGTYVRLTSGGTAADAPESPGELLQQAQGGGTSLTAVGRTTGLVAPCTAWLVDTGAAAEAPAYAVTSARCVGQSDPSSVMAGRDLENASVEFNAFASLTRASRSDLVTAPMEAVEWASTRGTDLAIVRLGSTYGELAERGVRPIDPVPPAPEGAEILIAGVPVEGIAPDQQYLRGSRCQAGGTSDVLEDALLWRAAQRSDCGGILSGSAGSPVFNPAGQAVAMVNTTTIGATQQVACAVGLPCEVADDGGTSVKDDTTYMVPVAALAACFPEGTFTLGGQCALEDPASVVQARAAVKSSRPGSTVEIRLDGELPEGMSSTAIRVKQGRLGEVDCRAPQGWLGAAAAAARAAAEAGVGDDDVVPGEAAASAGASPGTPASPGAGASPGTSSSAGSATASAPDAEEVTGPQPWVYPVILPTDEGFTMVCVGSASRPTEIVIRSDGTPPDAGLIELTTVAVEGGISVEPVFGPPELSQFRWVSGPAGAIDCSTAEGYVEYRGIPATIQAADLPSTVCVIATDEAGNESEPVAIEVD